MTKRLSQRGIDILLQQLLVCIVLLCLRNSIGRACTIVVVFPEVVEQVLLVPVLFVTGRTLELLPFGMHRHVSPQLGRSGAALSTVDAVVAVDAVVDPSM